MIILARHGRRWLADCVRTLADASTQRIRLVIVDNGGDNGLDALPLDAFDARVLAAPRAMAFAEANNFALQSLTLDTPAVCFLNQDTLSARGWLDTCLRLLGEMPNLAAVSPLIRTYDWSDWDGGFAECARRGNVPLDQLQATFTPLPMITAAAMVVRSSALLEVGPFDPIFGSYYEDYDLCARLRAAGYEVGICGGTSVAHYSGSATQSESENRVRMRRIIRNRFICRLRAAGTRRARAGLRYAAVDLPYNVGRAVWRTPSSQPIGVVLGAHLDLLPLLARILSPRRDREMWNSYLREIHWPTVA